MANDQSTESATTSHAEDTSARRTARVEWIERWRDVIASEPDLPGVWRRQEGGFHVRGRTTDPRTGKMKEINWALPNVTKARDAFAWLQNELERVRTGVVIEQPSQAPKFHAFGTAVFQRKLDLGKIRSEAGRAKWSSILDQHLFPAFGDFYMDQLKMADIKAWQVRIAKLIKAGEMSPATANTILGVLHQITDEAVDDYDIRDPMRGIDAFDTREHSTYTEEEPNSLAPDQVPSFLAKTLELHPQHYAFTFLGFTTGLRPSSLRPLRREGPSADVKWDDGILIVRRSQTIGDKVMETTKIDLHQRLTMPRELMDVLRWHVNEQLLHTPMRMSDLLFPSVHGGFRARSVLDKPFEEIAKAIGIKFNFTPKGMRRTYQDLARAAGIHDAVTRAISGHQTQEMQLLYSTARGGEVKQALSKVAKIATAGAKIIPITSVRRRKSA